MRYHLATARASDSSSRLDYVRVISTPIIIIIIILYNCLFIRCFHKFILDIN